MAGTGWSFTKQTLVISSNEIDSLESGWDSSNGLLKCGVGLFRCPNATSQSRCVLFLLIQWIEYLFLSQSVHPNTYM